MSHIWSLAETPQQEHSLKHADVSEKALANLLDLMDGACEATLRLSAGGHIRVMGGQDLAWKNKAGTNESQY